MLLILLFLKFLLLIVTAGFFRASVLNYLLVGYNYLFMYKFLSNILLRIRQKFAGILVCGSDHRSLGRPGMGRLQKNNTFLREISLFLLK